mmetsp:Transcript_143260/g.250062  ORF Transcript_143260/g.250062 Transcript_143260/m.250062 type:complete len:145 (-) Transcript_143260:32-466(-)
MQREVPVALAGLPLQLSLILSLSVGLLWVLLTLTMLVYKGLMLPFTTYIFVVELLCPVVVALLELVGFALGSKGNKAEMVGPLVLSLLLDIPAVVACGYFMYFQTYVLRLDFIIDIAYMACKGLVGLLKLAQMVVVLRAEIFLQ